MEWSSCSQRNNGGELQDDFSTRYCLLCGKPGVGGGELVGKFSTWPHNYWDLAFCWRIESQGKSRFIVRNILRQVRGTFIAKQRVILFKLVCVYLFLQVMENLTPSNPISYFKQPNSIYSVPLFYFHIFSIYQLSLIRIYLWIYLCTSITGYK